MQIYSKQLRRTTAPANQTPEKTVNLSNDYGDGVNSLTLLTGTKSKSLSQELLHQALNAQWQDPQSPPDEINRKTMAVAATMLELKPKDALEGMLVTQAVAAHAAAMECYRRAMHPKQTGEAAQMLRKNAASMTRTFVELVDVLDRKRGGTRQQVVRVERVMVGPGGQAIVGNVAAHSGPSDGGSGA